ncbi:uncharacterized protein B0H18DRAFT_1115799 [Fomitopsis serialis]|uniref:uncharacterized protein n=1 Tax=Fomitopsis serialis TaxID=139415 RepID=UPI002008BC4B|nr:uncharacterized protein B0H18DRAFT_1115799 [Neoantrodia serialis]KAH9932553.1 hypothetical protein B0H18DRAFT_1115799 [Neoantrodia serialis]
MASFEDLFNSSVLQVFAPGSALEFPDGVSGEKTKDWLSSLMQTYGQEDEIINFVLIIRFPHSQEESETTPEVVKPPISLLSFLAHLQISYEASTYLPSPLSRQLHLDKPVALLAAAHPNIFPPATPNPVPSAAKSDQQYVQSQGTQLTTGVWGDHHMGPTREMSEAFALLWAADEQEWVAVYRMSVLVRYMATKFEDPLLSLTVSTTLREKPLPITPPRRAIAALLEEVGGSENPLDIMSPIKSAAGDTTNNAEQDDDDDLLSGLEEINLLEDPTFANSEDAPLRLPSTRLGPKTRRTAFALPPVPGSSSSSQQSRASLTASAAAKTRLPPPPASATFRKSFRKTMKVVSGFHVRMRTVFVPYFLLPRNGQKKRKVISTNGTTDEDEDEDDVETREQREAGNEEHTVVLSVEIENTFPDIPVPTIPNYSFEIERADVTVSGTGAKTVLVAWGDAADVFPVRIGPNEQVNLLYAVSFLRAPEVDDMAMAPGTGGQAGKRTSVASAAAAAQEMRRSVSINISVLLLEDVGAKMVRNRCTADTSVAVPEHPSTRADYRGLELRAVVASTVPPSPSVAGNRKFTYSALDSPAIDGRNKAKSPVNYQGPTAMLNPANQPKAPYPSQRSSQHQPDHQWNLARGRQPCLFHAASVAFQSTYPRSPTTYASPQDSYFSFGALGQAQGQSQLTSPARKSLDAPHTSVPSVPRLSTTSATDPFWQARCAADRNVEVSAEVENKAEAGGQPIVVSVGLLPTIKEGSSKGKEGRQAIYTRWTIYAGYLRVQSELVDEKVRGEPSGREERRRKGKGDGKKTDGGSPGIMPLENRVRIGPLLPSTCQSVRMDFLALTPGVHPIDELVLTDVQSGFSMHLRSVMDVVVCEP